MKTLKIIIVILTISMNLYGQDEGAPVVQLMFGV